LAGRLATRRGQRALLIPGGLLYAAGSCLLLAGAGQDPQFLSVWLPAMLLTGLGVALIVPLLSSVAVQHLTPGQLAGGSGVFQALRQFASVIGITLSVLLLGAAPTTANVFAPIFALMIGGGLSVSWISLGLAPTPRQATLPVAAPPIEL
ncbi:MFS transporter, partial [Candidatus Gracilibacteria bacterium]|nr:MFS transporter [Candidatus Gracilibacteria bacterium]